MSWLRTLARVVLAVLIGLVVAAAVLVQGVRLSGRDLVVIAGGSMEPTISIGSLVVIERLPPESIRPGDIVSVRPGAERSLVTHRVERVVEQGGELKLELRGDANAEPDPVLVPASIVVGRVALALPGVGRIAAVGGTPAAVLLVLGTAGCLYSASLIGGMAGLRAPGRRPAPLASRPDC